MSPDHALEERHALYGRVSVGEAFGPVGTGTAVAALRNAESSFSDAWASLTLPDESPGGACLLPPDVMRRFARRPNPWNRLDVLFWARYTGWSRQNLLALAGWALARSVPNRFNGTPEQEVESAALTGRRDERNEPEDRPRLKSELVVEMLQSYALLASTHQWTGRTAGTDRAVYLAICSEALNAKWPGLRLPFSNRRASELAGVNKDTAGPALNRLVSMGFLRVVRQHGHASARRYEIRWPFEVQNLGQWLDQEPGPVPGTKNTVPGTAPCLAWSQAVLGRTCQRLVEALGTAEPRTDKEWYEAAGVKRRTFYANKDKLVNEVWPLVVRDAEGIYRPVPDIEDRLTQLAELTGAVQRNERKVQGHRLQRRGHVGYWLWATGLDAEFEYRDSRLVDRVTGELVRPEDAFSIERRERAQRPPERSIEAFRSEWVCPLIPGITWSPSDRSACVPVRVTVRADRPLAVAGPWAR